MHKNTIYLKTLLLLSLYTLSHTGPLIVRSATPGGDTADRLSQPLQYFYRITITKIACALCNFKNPFVDRRLRLPDYTQCEMRFCDTALFQLCSAGYALKVIQIKYGLT